MPRPVPVFYWLPVANITSLEKCRNSQQGRAMVVDELGGFDSLLIVGYIF